jgi:hypothetical protein
MYLDIFYVFLDSQGDSLPGSIHITNETSVQCKGNKTHPRPHPKTAAD